MEFTKENAEAAFTLVGKISNAPTLLDVLMLQKQFAQDRLQTFIAQTQQLFSVLEETFQKSEHGVMGAWTDIPTTRPSRSKKTLFNYMAAFPLGGNKKPRPGSGEGAVGPYAIRELLVVSADNS